MSDVLARLENVSFGHNGKTILRHVSFSVSAGERIALTGANGAGKSTLLKLMAGFLSPDSGSLYVTPQLAYLPQIYDSQRDFPLQVRQVVASGFWAEVGDFKPITRAMKQSVRDALAEVGLPDYGRHLLSELSGGQFQRVMLARVLVQQARLILLDEPFTGLDEAGQELLLSLVKKWQSENRAVLCVTHDADLVERHFCQKLRCQSGSVVADKTLVQDPLCAACGGAS